MDKIDDKIIVFRENIRNDKVLDTVSSLKFEFFDFSICRESLTGILEIKDSFETSSKMVSEKIPAFDFPRCIINRACDVTKTQILFEVQERVLMADGPGF